MSPHVVVAVREVLKAIVEDSVRSASELAARSRRLTQQHNSLKLPPSESSGVSVLAEEFEEANGYKTMIDVALWLVKNAQQRRRAAAITGTEDLIAAPVFSSSSSSSLSSPALRNERALSFPFAVSHRLLSQPHAARALDESAAGNLSLEMPALSVSIDDDSVLKRAGDAFDTSLSSGAYLLLCSSSSFSSSSSCAIAAFTSLLRSRLVPFFQCPFVFLPVFI